MKPITAFSKANKNDRKVSTAGASNGYGLIYNSSLQKFEPKPLPQGTMTGSLVQGSATNGKIVIDGVQTPVYTHPSNHSISEVSGLQAELDKMDDLKELVDTNLQVTVGTGGDFPTINEALVFLSRKYPSYVKSGLNVELKLLTGFVMSEQVHVKGIDLGWIKITSVDPVVFIQKSAITQVLIESRKPAFYGSDKAILPTIGCLFEYTTEGTNTKYDGITVAHGSKVQLLPGAGVNKAERGLGAYYGSEAFCYMEGLTEGGGGTGGGAVTGVSFKNCTGRAFMATYGSTIRCARSQLQYCTGDYAVYVIWGSQADIYQSDMSHASGTAVCSRDASFVNARETCVSDSQRGYHALHSGRINARYHVNEWSKDGAKRCSEYAVIASYGSQIDASELPVDGSDIGVHASNGSTVSFIDSATATGCRIGIYAASSGTIACDNVDVSNCTDTGIYALDSSTISANNSKANSCVNYGYRAENGSTITAEYSQANSCKEGFFATRASRINARSSVATGCTIYGVDAFEGSTVNAAYFNATGAGTYGFYVQRGSNIGAANATGTLSQAKLTLTASGVIYQ